MTPKEKEFGIDLNDEVVRGAIVTQNGDVIPPAPRPAPPPAPAKPPAAAKEAEVVAVTPFQKTSREVALITGGMGTALALGKLTGPLFMGNAFTFALASLIGYRVVWGVSPALHSPLMSVTNAISGMVGIGGLFILGEDTSPELSLRLLVRRPCCSLLSTCPVASSSPSACSICSDDQPIRRSTPGSTAYRRSCSVAASLPLRPPVPLVLSKPAIWSAPYSASAPFRALLLRPRRGMGNMLGMLGVGSGVLASLLAVGFSPEVLAQFGGLAALGSLAGFLIGKRITPTDLPQTVAALHSVVGLAAVLTSIGSVMADLSHVTTLHLVTAYLGVLIGRCILSSLFHARA